MPAALAGTFVLPAPVTPFVGRTRELQALRESLLRQDTRLVTLTGPGGVGKTRLALEAARALESSFRDGVGYVPLAAVQDHSLIAASMAQALGLTESDSLPPQDRLIAPLRERLMLLVIDNFEHLVGERSSALLSELLQSCRGVKLLVTSRTLLHLSGEQTFIVPPLALPERRLHDAEAPPPSPDEIGQVESVQLFVHRAQAARPEFTLSVANAPDVAAICERVDGLPLAIELAAARSAVLSPAELLSRLEQRLPLLTGGPQDQPQRLRTMRHAIAWSYDLLDPTTQDCLRRLAIFSGGFSVTGAEAVADPASDVLDSLAALVTSSLIQRHEQPNSDTRFTMLETVREYALDRLRAAGEEDRARAAHAAYYLGFMERAQAELWAGTNQALLDEIEAEHDNLRVALSWSIERDPLTALRMAGSLGPFWSKRSYWSEGRVWLERVLGSGSGDGSIARAIALGQLAGLASNQGDFEEARRAFEGSSALADELGDAHTAARSLRGLGIQASNQSDFARANQLFEQALVRFRSLDDRLGTARCLNDLGLVAGREGDQDRAIAFEEEALPIARAAGDEWQVCIILGNLGGAYYDRGDFTRGEALTQEALDFSRRLGDTFGVAVNLYNLGNCVVQLGDVGGALVRYQESLSLSVELGERHLASRTLDRLGVALHLAGSSRAGARLVGAAAAVHEALGDTFFAEEDANLSLRFQQIRESLGEATYLAVWESGHTLPFEQAVIESLAAADAALLTYQSAPARANSGLTVREIEVLRLLCDGHADKEIADRLFISARTASSHVASIIAKLGVDSRTAAVAAAFRSGLV